MNRGRLFDKSQQLVRSNDLNLLDCLITYCSVGWILVNRPVEVNIFVIRHLIGALVGQGHFFHYVQDEALYRNRHVPGQVHLIQLLEHFFEAVKEAVLAHDAQCLLSLDSRVIAIDFGVLQLAP